MKEKLTITHKEYARLMRENAVMRDGAVQVSPVLWEQIAGIIENSEEVVRCEECKHYGTSGCAMDTYAFDVVEEGFCSYGERRRV